jgi:HAD superfamily hydrolase (TIGR01490 family)
MRPNTLRVWPSVTSDIATPSPVLAVFDVDETLISCKSMFSFIEFAFKDHFGSAQGAMVFSAAMEHIQHARLSQPRETVNRLFYRNFANWSLAELDNLAVKWFDQNQGASFYLPEVLARFRDHQSDGHQTVLLSGSASFIIAPIAQDLGATKILAIDLERLSDGTTSGEIAGIQTIGRGKADALQHLIETDGPYAKVTGYGDHESDLPFLMMCDPAHYVHSVDSVVPAWARRLKSMPLSG